MDQPIGQLLAQGAPAADRAALLLVEDNPGDAILFEEGLAEACTNGKRYRVEHVETLREACARLAEGPYLAVICDLGLPDSTGIDTVRALRAADAQIAMVVLTGNDDARTAAMALEAGAQEYLAKGLLDGPLICLTLRNAIARKLGQRTREREHEAQLRVSELRAIALLDEPGEVRLRKQFEVVRTVPWLSGSGRGALYLVGEGGAPRFLGGHDWPEPLSSAVALDSDVIQRVPAAPSYWHVPLLGPRCTLVGFIQIEACPGEDFGDQALGLLRTSALLIASTAWRDQQDELLRRLSIAVEQSFDSIVICDAERRIIYVNGRICESTGYSEAELIGQTPKIWSSGLNPPELYAAMWGRLNAGKHWAGDLRNRRKNGEVYWERLSITPLIDGDGKVSHYVGVKIDITDVKAHQAELEHVALHDAVTGVLSRRALDECFEALFRAARPALLAIVDISGFRALNATYGHHVADQLLAGFAERLARALPRETPLIRLGADEFLVILEGEVQGGAARPLDTVRQVMRSPFLIGSYSIGIDVTIGVVRYPADGDKRETLLRRADQAQRAAHAGENAGLAWYTPQMEVEIEQRSWISVELRRALSEGQLAVHYQPKIDLATGSLQGWEALVRWEHPERGQIPPMRFIPVAEATGMIGELDDWVFAQACRTLAEFERLTGARRIMAVNVSAIQFAQIDFVSGLRSMAASAGVLPGQIELELTESALMADPQRAVDKMRQLKGLGFRIAIDDFGTGYSSLSHLKRFPIDTIKIDRSFIRDIVTDPNDAVISRTIIAMADSLGLEVVAEGIETAEQLALVRRLGCAIGQGYLFARPMPEQDAAARLGANSWLPAKGAADDPTGGLLILDDEPNVVSALNRVLRKQGFAVHCTTDPYEALAILARERIGVVLSDQRMPVMTGTEFFAKVKEMYPETVRIIITGYTDLDTMITAVNQGFVYRFLTKPWDDEELRRNIREAFVHYRNARGLGTGSHNQAA